MKKTLIVIDMQNDFINGSLGTAEAQAIVPKVREKIEKLDKYFNDSVNAQITLSVEKLSHIIEITIPFNGSVLRAEVEGKNMYNIFMGRIVFGAKQEV